MDKPPSSVPDDYFPVELTHRHGSWTAERQVDFLLALFDTSCGDATTAAPTRHHHPHDRDHA